MASSASTHSSDGPASPASSSVDELRGILASNGLVVKDSIIQRLAKKSKSFKSTVQATETLKQATDPVPQTPEQPSDPGSDASSKDEDVGFEQRLQALVQPKDSENRCASKNLVKENSTSDVSGNGSSSAPVDLVSEEEKKQRRAERFGTVSEDEKLKLRAARFGENNHIDEKEEAEKKRARAARFGIVDEDAKKKARLERFGKDTVEDPLEIEKRKARAARFALPLKDS